jgi:uncharacterized protein YdaU (DUF1376 family)
LAKIPYMRFYPGDWLSDPKVRRLTWEQKGIYIDMLSLMWKNGENASLPDDPDAIASMLGIQKRKFLKIFRVFFEKNFEIFFRADGRIFQKRVLSEWEAANEKSQKATESAKRRWESGDGCERNANAMRTQCERNASHSSYSYSYKDIKDLKHMSETLEKPSRASDDSGSENHISPAESVMELTVPDEKVCNPTLPPKKKPQAKKLFTYPDEFQQFWDAFPNFSRNKKGAYRAWLAALNGGEARTRVATIDELQRAAVNYAKAMRGKEKEFVLHAATFLGPTERWIEYIGGAKQTASTPAANDEYRLTDTQRELQDKRMEAFFAQHPELKEDGNGG